MDVVSGSSFLDLSKRFKAGVRYSLLTKPLRKWVKVKRNERLSRV